MLVVGIPLLNWPEAGALPTAHRALVPELWIDGDARPPSFAQQVTGEGPRRVGTQPAAARRWNQEHVETGHVRLVAKPCLEVADRVSGHLDDVGIDVRPREPGEQFLP